MHPGWLESFLFAFIPLFVAIDPLGLVPVYLSMASAVSPERRHRLAYQAATTAALVAVGFLFLGKGIFAALGITVADFQLAGGLILLALATQDILFSDRRDAYVGDDFGVVPLGMPLIAGPAMLTTILALVDAVGVLLTLGALAANLLLVAVVLRFSDLLRCWLGMTALRAVSRIVALLLAAIAVNLIRRGWQAVG